MNTQHTEPKKEKWEIVAEIIDGLQNILENEGMNTEKLVQHLAEAFPSNFPVDNSKLSVVYWAYTTAQYKVLIEDGKPRDGLYLKNPNLPSDAVESNLVLSVPLEATRLFQQTEVFLRGISKTGDWMPYPPLGS